jgi:CBS domain-containing protein
MPLGSRKAISLASRPVVAPTDTTVRELVGMMVENDTRRIPVVSAGDKVVGMVISRTVLDYVGGGPKANIWMLEMGRDLARGLNAVPIERIMSSHVISLPSTASVLEVLKVLLRTGVGGLPLLKGGRAEGIISERDLVSLITKKTGVPVEFHMSRHLITANPATSLLSLCKLVVSMDLRRLPVVAEGGLVGIITSMDLLRALNLDSIQKLILAGQADDVFRMEIKNFMTREVITIEHDADLQEAAQLMVREEISGLPVLRDGKLEGIITAHDLLRWLIYHI